MATNSDALLAALLGNISALANSDSGNSSNANQNRLAVTALAVSLVALLCSTMQVILEYASASNARYKCSQSAIHVSNRFVQRKWTFRHWKWEYKYPHISFSLEDLLSSQKDDKRSIKNSFFRGLVSESNGSLGWSSLVDLTPHLDTRLVSDGVHFLDYHLKANSSTDNVENDRNNDPKDGSNHDLKDNSKDEPGLRSGTIEANVHARIHGRIPSNGFGGLLRRTRSLWRLAASWLRSHFPAIQFVLGNGQIPWYLNRNTLVTTEDLPWSSWLRYRWWCFWNPRQPPRRPRASWAQVLRAFGLCDTSPLLTQPLIDAETIPSCIDVPIQRVRLYDLGRIAMTLGFSTVKINAERREFEATGPYGSFTTEDILNFGKVIRFDGDTFKIYELTAAVAVWLKFWKDFQLGQLCVTPMGSSITYFRLDLFTKGVVSGLKGPEIDRQMRSRAVKQDMDKFNGLGNMKLEAEGIGRLTEELISKETSVIFGINRAETEGEITAWKLEKKYGSISSKQRDIKDTRFEKYEPAISKAFFIWQTKTGCRVPTTLAVASFAALPGIVPGYPSSLILDPLLDVLRLISGELFKRLGENFITSDALFESVIAGNVDFANEMDEYNMTRRLVSINGDYTWSTPDDDELLQLYNDLPEFVRAELTTEAKVGEPTSAVGLVMAPCVRLLRAFDPRQWAAKVEAQYNSPQKYFRVPNLLWIQVVVLDIAIRINIRGYMQNLCRAPGSQQHWEQSEIAVLRAITSSWKQDWMKTQSESVGIGESASGKLPETAATGATNGTTSVASSVQDRVTEKHEGSDPGAILTPNTKPGGESPHASTALHKDDVNLPWDLKDHLYANLKDFYGDKQSSNLELRAERLEDLLKLRALFFIAFLMIMPDSSDVVLARNSEVEMPMI